jgi:predicted HicB family RNase H-like nuclease
MPSGAEITWVEWGGGITSADRVERRPGRFSQAAPSEGNRQRSRQVHAAIPDRSDSHALMDYKGCIGKVEFDEEAGIIRGEVISTRDVITFQGDSVAELKQAFHESVDDYLEFCETRGETPDKLFSGQVVTRISPDLHLQVKVAAVRFGISLNACVAEQLAGAVLRIGAVQAAGTKKRSVTAAKRKTAIFECETIADHGRQWWLEQSPTQTSLRSESDAVVSWRMELRDPATNLAPPISFGK